MTELQAQQPLADAAARERAVDPRFSCIVQAPAGSGKTTLLATRYVELLANVTQPLPLRIIGGTIKDLQPFQKQNLKQRRDPSPHNGSATYRSTSCSSRDNQSSGVRAGSNGMLKLPKPSLFISAERA